MSTQKQPVPASTLAKFITMGQLPAIRDAIVNSVMQRLESTPKTAVPAPITIDQVEEIAAKVATTITKELVEKMWGELKTEIQKDIRSSLTSDDSPAQIVEVLEGNTTEVVIPVEQPAEAVVSEGQPAAKPAAKLGRPKKTAEPKGKAASKDAPQAKQAGTGSTDTEKIKKINSIAVNEGFRLTPDQIEELVRLDLNDEKIHEQVQKWKELAEKTTSTPATTRKGDAASVSALADLMKE
jgi:hypothetical protein